MYRFTLKSALKTTYRRGLFLGFVLLIVIFAGLVAAQDWRSPGKDASRSSASQTSDGPSGELAFGFDEGADDPQSLGLGDHRIHLVFRVDSNSTDVSSFHHALKVRFSDGTALPPVSIEATDTLRNRFALRFYTRVEQNPGDSIAKLYCAGEAHIHSYRMQPGSVNDGLIIIISLSVEHAGKHLIIDTLENEDPMVWGHDSDHGTPRWSALDFRVNSALQRYVVTRLEDDHNEGSLRWSMEQAYAGSAEIEFDIGGTIAVTEPFPEVTGGVAIHGKTAPSPVVIDGSATTNDTCFTVSAIIPPFPGALIIDSIEIANFYCGVAAPDGYLLLENSFIHGCQYGVQLKDISCDVRSNVVSDNDVGCVIGYSSDGHIGALGHHRISHNKIGTTPDGLDFLPNLLGILFSSGGDYTKVQNNVICADSVGIVLGWKVETPSDIEVSGNVIGLNAAGVPLGGALGISNLPETIRDWESFPHGNWFHNNTISGHKYYGVYLCFASAPLSAGCLYGPNAFTNNKIGTDPAGTEAIPNDSGGFFFGTPYQYQYETDDTVGCPPIEMSANLIAGNGGPGITLTNLRGVVLQENVIGVSSEGLPLPNDGAGILLKYVDIADIGTESWPNPNIISYNQGPGVELYSCSLIVISSCVIDSNESHGVSIDRDYGSSVGPGNHIVGNGGAGVAITAEESYGTTVTRSEIYDNAGLGIDLGFDGVTVNDPGDADTGPSQLLNYPEFGEPSFGNDSLAVVPGTACPDCIVELFVVYGPEGSGIEADPSGYGEGYQYIGTDTCDASGQFSIADAPAYSYVTATATDTAGNTSEFAPNFYIGTRERLVLNSNADGPGSLAAVIATANATPGMDLIKFAPTVTDPIVLSSALPNLMDATGGTIIDGQSAGGGSHSVVIDGSNLIQNESGITLASDNNTVCGLTIVGFGGSGVSIQSGANNRIYDNYIGVQSDGVTPAGNNVGIQGGGLGIEIGVDGGNVVSGNELWGIILVDAPGAVVTNNLIGTDAGGTASIPNNSSYSSGLFAVWLDACDNAVLTDNLISGNDLYSTWAGLRVQNSSGVLVQTNKIGTDINGLSSLPNDQDGVLLQDCTDPEVRDNVLSGNGASGLRLRRCVGAIVVGNKVGTDIYGTNAIANGWLYDLPGIKIENSENTVIGGGLASQRNVVSGNTAGGIVVEYLDETKATSASSNLNDAIGAESVSKYTSQSDLNYQQVQHTVIVNNCVGVGADGTTPIPNLQGICVIGSSGDVVGTELPEERNIIAHNSACGVLIEGALNTEVEGNLITANDTGVCLLGGAQSCQITNNQIIDNRLSITSFGSATKYNLLVDNEIHGCTQGPDIDLWPEGITHPGGWNTDSPNDNMNYPYVYLDLATGCATLAGSPGGSVYLYCVKDKSAGIDASFTDESDRSHGGAMFLLGSTDCGEFGSCDDICGLNSGPLALEEGDIITGLSVDVNNNTSEFACNYIIQQTAVEGLSPILLQVEDPVGNMIDASTNDIPGAVYDSLTDANGDGMPDDRILLPGRLVGQYRISVVPAPGAEPTDTYSLRVVSAGDTTYLTQNKTVPPAGSTDEFDYTSAIPSSCCVGFTGNVDCDGDGKRNLADITRLIDRVYLSKLPLCCEESGNTDGDTDNKINLADITRLIDHVYLSKLPTAACH